MEHRLFVAIRPPAAVRDALLAAMEGIAGARWQDDHQLHLTLRFVGAVDDARAEDLALALSRLHGSSFPLTLAGVGVFERKRRPHTLWAGVAASEALHTLQRKVERACIAAGLPPEARRYAPHVTLARLNTSSGPVGDFMLRHGALRTAEWTVGEFALYESHLGADGARYVPVVRYPLDQ